MKRIRVLFLFPLLAVSTLSAPLAHSQDRSTPPTISPTSLSFAPPAGSTGIVHKSLSVTDSTAVRFSVSASVTSGGSAWLSVSPSGALTTPQSIRVSANPAGLAPATYTGAVRIRYAEERYVNVPVTLTVSSAAGTLTVTPASLSFSAIANGASPSAQSLAIAAKPKTTWTASVSGTPWLTVSPSTGATPATLTVSSSVSGLSAGTFTGSIHVTGNGKSIAVPVSFTVNKASQSITFTAPASVTFGVAPIALSATATSGLPVSFTAIPSGVCSVSGSSLAIAGAGSCVVTATQAGNAGYSAAASVSQTVTVNKAAQNITFTAPTSVTLGSSPIALSATASSGLPVSFTATPSGVCSVAGSSLAFAGVGSCLVTATQAGNANYSAAAPIAQTVVVSNNNKTSQTITFAALAPVTFGAPPFTLSASASSGLPVTFSATPSTVCSLSGLSLAIAGAGSCVVTASQAGNATYAAAPSVSQTLVVSKASQTISFAALAPVTYGASPFTISATASSSLPVSLVASPSTVCSLAGSSLTIAGAGTCSVTASQAGNANYAAASSVSQTFTVNKAAQTIAFSQPTSPVTFTTGLTVPLAATSSAGLPVLFTLDPASSGAGSVSGASLSVTAAGSLVIDANQPGNANVAAAPQVQRTLVVNAATGSGLSVSPASLSYAALAGGTSQALASFRVTSASATAFTVATSGLTWLSASPSSAASPATVDVTASISGLTAGAYTGSVIVSGNGSTVTVPVTVTISAGTGGPFRLVGWNDLGMHCFDGKDYSTFGVLPPYNTIHAHLVDTSGSLVTAPGTFTLEYAAIPDPATGAITSTSAPKTNFWDYASFLSLGSPAPDVGITGNAMPGTPNKPQPMTWSATDNTWVATGIPEFPYADNGTTNYFPMMRVTARNSSGSVLATTDIVLPTSDEMSCATCHASGSNPNAMPKSGWANNPVPAVDVKLNILRRHDDAEVADPLFQTSVTTLGFNPAGLEATVRSRPVLCAQCHGSNALGMAGATGVKPLTQAMHALHSAVVDPATGATMDSSTVRNTCYSCHPGPKTQCLRGAMANLTTTSGAPAVECQSCHGNLTAVADPSRQGWLSVPTCQSCHTGLASATNTTQAYTSVFSSGATVRVPADTTFATAANTPSTGLSMYRYSSGHGGMQCESCHGSTHAEFPTSQLNDNVQSNNLQGHSGVLAECSTCHSTVPSTTNGGPHGLHPIGSAWVSQHQNVAQGGTTTCQGCHGTDYRGTVLSRIQANRTLAGHSFTAGTIIGCYSCHNGPSGG